MTTTHPADDHALIRVEGARENNLKNVSVELPKRRLTVFTGVSGSGKSSLVFATIAAESQRMINETYSAFVQGFMPTLARPEVDVLDGLTTAILVDQERMGSNPRSTVGTATDGSSRPRTHSARSLICSAQTSAMLTPPIFDERAASLSRVPSHSGQVVNVTARSTNAPTCGCIASRSLARNDFWIDGIRPA